MSAIALTLALAAFPQEPAASSGPIEGHVLDAERQAVPNAYVVLFDRATGMPLGDESYKPFIRHEEGQKHSTFEDWVHTLTDDQGAFRFDAVPPGKYRVIAQSFPDQVEGGPLEQHGLSVDLRGMAEVEVPGAAVELKPLGTGTFVYDRGASNDDWYLFLSTGAPRADAVLGPLGWSGPFLEQGIGWMRMKDGECIVRGLPGKRCHFTIFANDSSPCFGQGSFLVFAGKVATSKQNLVGGWSDAIHDPPKELEALTDKCDEYMETEGYAGIEAILTKGREEAWAQYERRQGFSALFDSARILGPLERELDLPWGGKATVGEVMAASAYARLRAR